MELIKMHHALKNLLGAKAIRGQSVPADDASDVILLADAAAVLEQAEPVVQDWDLLAETQGALRDAWAILKNLLSSGTLQVCLLQL